MNLFNMGNSLSTAKLSEVYVHFEGRKVRVTFNAEDYNKEGEIPMQQFRNRLARTFGVPPSSLTLYTRSPQKKLSISSTLQRYNITNGTELIAVKNEEPSNVAGKFTNKNSQSSGSGTRKPSGSGTSTSAPAATATAPPKPTTSIEKIDGIVDSVENGLGHRIAAFVKQPPADPKIRDQENRILCETILAKTISLDNVDVTTSEERQTRKNAIAKLQGYHKKIDEAMTRANASEAAGESSGGVANVETAQLETANAPVAEENTQTITAQTSGSSASKNKKKKKKKKGKK